jgi:WD40 repeat protein
MGSDASVSAVGGTVAYMSPEQSARQRLTPKTDLWSWGVSVLEMLLGERTWLSGVAALDALEDYASPGSELAADAKIGSPPGQLVELLRQCFSYDLVQRPADMLEVAGRLQEIYRREVGQAYPRQLPKAAELRADSLNNKALSMLDLGKEQDAVDAWCRALEIDPHHAEATYNLGSWRWQAAQQTDLDLVHQLEAVVRTQAGAWLPKYLLGLVHMRRQDIPAARQLLEEAFRMAPAEDHLQAEIRCLDQIPPVGCLRSLTGHSGSVNAVAILPDGHRCLSAGDDCILQLWDLDGGRQLQTFEGHTESVTHIAITPDGKKAVSGGWDKTLRVWDLPGGDCLSVLEGGLFDPVNTIYIKSGGHQAVSISGSVLQVWNLDTGVSLERRNILDGDGFGSHTILPDERRMISGTLDCSLCIWDLANGKCLTTLKGHKERISAVAITPDGKRVVSAGHNYTNQDRSLRVWDLNTGICQGLLQGHSDEAFAIVIAPNGKQVVSAGRDKTLRVWDLASGRCLRTLEGHMNSVFDLALSSDGLKIVSASADKTLRVWQLNPLDQVPVQWALNRPASSQDVQKGAAQVHQMLATAEIELNANNVTGAASLLRQALLISGFERDSAILDLWHTAGRKAGKPVGLREVHLQQTLQGHSSRVHIVAATPDRQQIISGSWDNTLRIWDLATGQCLRVLEGHKQNIHSLAISRDGRLAVSGSEDKTLRVWDLTAGACLHTLQGHDSWVKSVALTSDGLRALSASGDKALRLWDMRSGACLQILEGHTHYVETVAISPDGSLAVSGGFDHTLRVWDLRNGKCLRILQGHDNLVNAVLFTPDGRQIISAGCFDKTLRVWDLASGKCLHILQRHTAAISSITLTSDGRKVISCSEDGSLRVWDLQNGQCLLTLTGHTGKVKAAAVTPDGRWAVSCCSDMTLRLWNLQSGKCLHTLLGHTADIMSVAVSLDSRWVVSGSSDRSMQVWLLDWEYQFPDLSDWDPGALPYLVHFLAVLPQVRSGLLQKSRPAWTEMDFKGLLYTLGCAGYGWLKPEGVRKELERMASGRK